MRLTQAGRIPPRLPASSPLPSIGMGGAVSLMPALHRAGLLPTRPALGRPNLIVPGIGLGAFVLAITIAGICYALISLLEVPETPAPVSALERYALPLVAVVGLGVAGYLAYVELFHAEAFCGPIVGCNVVQSSRYAKLFGVLPIGVLGAVGYLLILACAAAREARGGRQVRAARLAIYGGALFGTAFSAYLTGLEIFVIHAVCIWCLSSAVLITLVLSLSARPAASSL